jgi:hypothetical protein
MQKPLILQGLCGFSCLTLLNKVMFGEILDAVYIDRIAAIVNQQKGDVK